MSALPPDCVAKLGCFSTIRVGGVFLSLPLRRSPARGDGIDAFGTDIQLITSKRDRRVLEVPPHGKVNFFDRI
jgi:hypothetical protein